MILGDFGDTPCSNSLQIPHLAILIGTVWIAVVEIVARPQHEQSALNVVNGL